MRVWARILIDEAKGGAFGMENSWGLGSVRRCTYGAFPWALGFFLFSGRWRIYLLRRIADRLGRHDSVIHTSSLLIQGVALSGTHVFC